MPPAPHSQRSPLLSSLPLRHLSVLAFLSFASKIAGCFLESQSPVYGVYGTSSHCSLLRYFSYRSLCGAHDPSHQQLIAALDDLVVIQHVEQALPKKVFRDSLAASATEPHLPVRTRNLGNNLVSDRIIPQPQRA